MYKHPTAIIETDKIGQGTRIWAFAHILNGAQLGSDCNIGDHVFIEGGAVVGNRVTVKNLVMIWDGVTLEDDVFVGPNVVFTNDRRPRSPRAQAATERYSNRAWLSKTIVKAGASVGANSTILSGITLGTYSMVGAGAVVTRDVAAHALVVGIPAKQVGWVSDTGASLSFKDGIARCEDTGIIWKLTGSDIVKVAEMGSIGSIERSNVK